MVQVDGFSSFEQRSSCVRGGTAFAHEQERYKGKYLVRFAEIPKGFEACARKRAFQESQAGDLIGIPHRIDSPDRSTPVTTLEGLGTPEKPHPIQQAFIEEGAAQCGFCLSGVILTAKAVLDVKRDASDQEIRDALGGVLCRCFTHTRMLRAIRKYAEARRA
jgi:hypothetical protein